MMLSLLLLPLAGVAPPGEAPALLADPGLPSTATASTAPAAREEIELYWPNGVLRAKYSVDGQGRLHGAYLEYHENGELAVRARYRADRLDGRYETFGAGGERELRTHYRDGLLEGKHEVWGEDGERSLVGEHEAGERHGHFTWYRAGESVSEQEWEAGRIVLLEGREPFPRPRAEVEATLARIHGSRELEVGDLHASATGREVDADGDLSEGARAAQERGRERALRRLMGYRYLSGVPWEDLRLDASYNHYTSMAARLLARLGELDHTPENPGLPAAEFRDGYRGTSHSNLSRGSDLAGSIDSYMDDSDPSNIDRVGHRLWCLNPAMAETGFGRRGSFSAMWSFDTGRGKIPRYETVLYPAAGYYPSDHFGDRHAWSVQLAPSGSWPSKLHEVEAVVRPLDENYVPTGEVLELDHRGFARNAFVFRPVDLSSAPGKRYAVEIRGARGSAFEQGVHYVVEFIEPVEFVESVERDENAPSEDS